MATEPPAKPRTRLVRASKLPRDFAIPTTGPDRAKASAVRIGRKVRVSCMGQSVILTLSQRVRVLVEDSCSRKDER